MRRKKKTTRKKEEHEEEADILPSDMYIQKRRLYTAVLTEIVNGKRDRVQQRLTSPKLENI